jgi:hypothetical protein
MFLHGVLEEEVYMRQPQGFEDPHGPLSHLQTCKTLYVMKYGTRAWILPQFEVT